MLVHLCKTEMVFLFFFRVPTWEYKVQVNVDERMRMGECTRGNVDGGMQTGDTDEGCGWRMWVGYVPTAAL